MNNFKIRLNLNQFAFKINKQNKTGRYIYTHTHTPIVTNNSKVLESWKLKVKLVKLLVGGEKKISTFSASH